MKKNIFKNLLLAGIVAVLLSVMVIGDLPVFAQTMQGDSNWAVTFTSDKKMESNFKTSDIMDIARGMQPGDNAIITLKLTNTNSNTTNWYMENEVIKSLEDAEDTKHKKTSGGAYTYILTYTNPEGEDTILYSSDTVGGDTISKAGQGLNEATNSLDSWFLLDELKKGESGKIVLEVALDGETQGNRYQDTLADIKMDFAVELPDQSTTTVTPTPTGSGNPPGTSTNRRTSVQTGDTNTPILYLVLAGVAGLILLILAIRSMQLRKKERVSVAQKSTEQRKERRDDR